MSTALQKYAWLGGSLKRSPATYHRVSWSEHFACEASLEVKVVEDRSKAGQAQQTSTVRLSLVILGMKRGWTMVDDGRDIFSGHDRAILFCLIFVYKRVKLA